MISEKLVKRADRGFKIGEDAFLQDVQSELVDINSEITSYTYDNIMVVLTTVDKVESMSGRNASLGTDINALLQQVDMYIKRSLYTADKKKELDAAKDKIALVKQYEQHIKTLLTIYEKISENILRQQFHTAVMLYKYIEEKKLAEAVDVPEITQIHLALKQAATAKLEKGVMTMVDTFLNYCSSKQKEIADRLFRQADASIKQMYALSGLHPKNRVTHNIRMSYVNGNIVQRDLNADRQSDVYRRTTVVVDLQTAGSAAEEKVCEKLDVHILKNCIAIHEILNDQASFLETLYKSRCSYLYKDLALVSKNINEIKLVSCSILAYFLVQQQFDEACGGHMLEKMMKEYQDKAMLQLVESSKYGYSFKDIFALKQVFHHCAAVSKTHNVSKLEVMYIDMCDTLLPIFYLKLTNDMLGSIDDWLKTHKLDRVDIPTLEDYVNRVEKFGLNIDGLNSEIYKLLDKPFTGMKAHFSNLFLFVVEKIERFIDNISMYLKGIYDFDGKIFTYTKEYLLKVNDTLKQFCRKEGLDIVTLSFVSNDIMKLQSISAYILEYIKKQTSISYSYDINVAHLFAQLKTEVDAKIHAEYPLLLYQHLIHYNNIKWQEKKPLTEPRLFVLEMGEFIRTKLTQIADINYSIGVSLAYLTYREINKALAELFAHKAKNFNIVDVQIVDVELDYLCRLADEEFFHLDKLKDTLNPMVQFAHLFMLHHPNEYMDASKRAEKFYSLGPGFLLKVLPKYKKKLVDGLPQVRRRECEALCKYITDNMPA